MHKRTRIELYDDAINGLLYARFFARSAQEDHDWSLLTRAKVEYDRIRVLCEVHRLCVGQSFSDLEGAEAVLSFCDANGLPTMLDDDARAEASAERYLKHLICRVYEEFTEIESEMKEKDEKQKYLEETKGIESGYV